MPPKRKSTAAVAEADASTASPLRRSSRRTGQTEEPETKPTPPAKRARTGKAPAAQKPAPKAAKGKARTGPSFEEAAPSAGPSRKRKAAAAAAPTRPAKQAKGKGKGKGVVTAEDDPNERPEAEEVSAEEVDVPSTTASAAAPPAETAPSSAPTVKQERDDPDRQYWLLKAEPESRFENGVDVRFSIDDLAACTAPEPWDGIRNYAARNNLRKMKKGDLAFFYHSNTKEPGIVGTMTIVREHSPDLAAHDPKTAYYDPKAAADLAAGKEPKWSVVHVQFRSKFAAPITLKDLRNLGGPGQPLDKMQMLKQSRLSVSQVSAEEWKHLLGVAKAT